MLIIPPFTVLRAVGAALVGAADFSLGGQNFYPADQGAFTGEIAPAMLLDAGCRYALAGHSERRHILGEDDALVGRKVTFGLAAGLSMEGRAPATIWNALELVRRIVNFGAKAKLCPPLPFVIEMPKKDNEVVEYLEPEESARLQEVLDTCALNSHHPKCPITQYSQYSRKYL